MTKKYNIGDIVEFASVSRGTIISTVKSLINSDGIISLAWIASDGKMTQAGIRAARIVRVIKATSPTHNYKVGDVIKWTNKTSKGELYKVFSVNQTPHKYGLVNLSSKSSYTNVRAPSDLTRLVTAANQIQAVEVDRCKWATKQPIDVEPVYYRTYQPSADCASPSITAQMNSSEAIVVKRAQHHGVRAVPFCSVTDNPVDIVGRSISHEDKLKAEAFLYCTNCGGGEY